MMMEARGGPVGMFGERRTVRLSNPSSGLSLRVLGGPEAPVMSKLHYGPRLSESAVCISTFSHGRLRDSFPRRRPNGTPSHCDAYHDETCDDSHQRNRLADIHMFLEYCHGENHGHYRICA